jgi:hypothetical protein
MKSEYSLSGHLASPVSRNLVGLAGLVRCSLTAQRRRPKIRNDFLGAKFCSLKENAITLERFRQIRNPDEGKAKISLHFYRSSKQENAHKFGDIGSN